MNKVTLNDKEQKRLMVLNEVLAGRLTGSAAAELLGLSLRQTRRLMAGYRRAGAVGLAHGNRGRSPVNKVSAEVAEAVVRLAREEYADYNDRHLTEELAEQHGIALSSPTVRRLRRAAGLGSPRKRRTPRPRRRVSCCIWLPSASPASGQRPSGTGPMKLSATTSRWPSAATPPIPAFASWPRWMPTSGRSSTPSAATSPPPACPISWPRSMPPTLRQSRSRLLPCVFASLRPCVNLFSPPPPLCACTSPR